MKAEDYDDELFVKVKDDLVKDCDIHIKFINKHALPTAGDIVLIYEIHAKAAV